MTCGWKLDRDLRESLLVAHPPRYANAVADHVTLSVSLSQPPAPARRPRIVGHVDDQSGVEAMVVEIEGSTARPDGKVWHITWSLADGRTARESNDVIAALGWTPLDGVELRLQSAVW